MGEDILVLERQDADLHPQQSPYIGTIYYSIRYIIDCRLTHIENDCNGEKCRSPKNGALYPHKKHKNEERSAEGTHRENGQQNEEGSPYAKRQRMNTDKRVCMNGAGKGVWREWTISQEKYRVCSQEGLHRRNE